MREQPTQLIVLFVFLSFVPFPHFCGGGLCIQAILYIPYALSRIYSPSSLYNPSRQLESGRIFLQEINQSKGFLGGEDGICGENHTDLENGWKKE